MTHGGNAEGSESQVAPDQLASEERLAPSASPTYEERLDANSFASRYDPLRDAVRRFLSVWEQEDDQEKNDLSEELWGAVQNMRAVYEARNR
jgi:hypothetical protein